MEPAARARGPESSNWDKGWYGLLAFEPLDNHDPSLVGELEAWQKGLKRGLHTWLSLGSSDCPAALAR